MAVNPLQMLASSMLSSQKATQGSGDTDTGNFAGMVSEAVQGVVASQKGAEQLTIAAASGQDVPLQEVIQAVAEAELKLQTMMTMRDRALEAYQEIMRMPI